jgi:hypothetical protein
MTSRSMSKLLAAGAMSLVAAGSAHAAAYELHFTGTDISGTFVALTNASNVVTSITGSFTDTALSPSAYTLSGLTGYASADNHLVGSPLQITYAGISFSTDAGVGNDFNLFDNGGGNYFLLAQSNDPGGAAYSGMPQLNLSATAVPEPASLTLMLAGLLGVIGLTRRRGAR